MSLYNPWVITMHHKFGWYPVTASLQAKRWLYCIKHKSNIIISRLKFNECSHALNHPNYGGQSCLGYISGHYMQSTTFVSLGMRQHVFTILYQSTDGGGNTYNMCITKLLCLLEKATEWLVCSQDFLNLCEHVSGLSGTPFTATESPTVHTCIYNTTHTTAPKQ